jgi:hypothetical protein
MTHIHLRRRAHQYRQPEEWESVRHERHDLRDQAVLDSKNIHRQGKPGGIAGPTQVSCDRRLQVGVGHNAAEAAKSFGDHDTPAPLRSFLKDHTIKKTKDLGPDMLSNGELLRAAEERPLKYFSQPTRIFVINAGPSEFI